MTAKTDLSKSKGHDAVCPTCGTCPTCGAKKQEAAPIQYVPYYVPMWTQSYVWPNTPYIGPWQWSTGPTSTIAADQGQSNVTYMVNV